MDDVATARSENANLRKIREKLLLWDVKDNPLAPLAAEQQDAIDVLTQVLSNHEHREELRETVEVSSSTSLFKSTSQDDSKISIPSKSFQELLKLPNQDIETTTDFLFWYDKVNNEIHDHANAMYLKFYQELESRKDECDKILDKTDSGLQELNELQTEYEFVSNKTSSLNTASEKLLREQSDLSELCQEIGHRLRYFKQAEQLSQRLQSPTLSVASDSFKEVLNEIDSCLEYLMTHLKFKESSSYIIKYKHCLSKAITLMKNYVENTLSQATDQILAPKSASVGLANKSGSEAAFALYYGKFHTTAVKVKRISSMIEERCGKDHSIIEYDQLLSELHQCYLIQRANVMSPAVDNSIKDLKANNRGDHCTLIRSACAFLVHVCQDEYRLFYQFFSLPTDQLNSYLEGLCIILYDTLRPFIIHINHLETLAEICSIFKVEMIEEYVQQNADSLEAFGKIIYQLLQDVQERLVFRAHLYLQSDILNYNPSPGDLAYPDKLEMMESIALSLQEPHFLKRSDSRSSITSTVSSVAHETESVDTAIQGRSINSPADLHGMWYPTVRRTLVCLSRLYRCVDRPIFQGLSQEALKYCIQSVSSAASKISANKTQIDGELFEIKHLLILREQIAPFRVDFTVKETTLDFSKIKTAAFGLIQRRKQLFSLGSNNALLEFLLDGTPEVKEHLIDSRKDVDRQLKGVCEQFIRDAVQMLIGPIIQFVEKAQNLLATAAVGTTIETQTNNKQLPQQKVSILKQMPWASPQQINNYVQESQRNIKNKLSSLQRSMQLYLSNRDTEFIIFRPIRNNIISGFVKLEQLLATNGYTNDDLIIISCPSAEQVSILLSSASIMATTIDMSSARRLSTSSTTSAIDATTRKVSVEKKVSFDEPPSITANLQEMKEEDEINKTEA